MIFGYPYLFLQIQQSDGKKIPFYEFLRNLNITEYNLKYSPVTPMYAPFVSQADLSKKASENGSSSFNFTLEMPFESLQRVREGIGFGTDIIYTQFGYSPDFKSEEYAWRIASPPIPSFDLENSSLSFECTYRIGSYIEVAKLKAVDINYSFKAGDTVGTVIDKLFELIKISKDGYEIKSMYEPILKTVIGLTDTPVNTNFYTWMIDTFRKLNIGIAFEAVGNKIIVRLAEYNKIELTPEGGNIVQFVSKEFMPSRLSFTEDVVTLPLLSLSIETPIRTGMAQKKNEIKTNEAGEDVQTGDVVTTPHPNYSNLAVSEEMFPLLSTTVNISSIMWPYINPYETKVRLITPLKQLRDKLLSVWAVRYSLAGDFGMDLELRLTESFREEGGVVVPILDNMIYDNFMQPGVFQA